jgi:NitT/TauT family transport system substrate-binding protein
MAIARFMQRKLVDLLSQPIKYCYTALRNYLAPIALAKNGLVSILVAAAILLLNGCINNQALPMLRLGMNDWPGYAIAIYAQEAKLFEKRGIQVEIIKFNNQQDNIRATIRGAQDMSFVTLWELMQIDPGNDKPAVILAADVSAGSDAIVARSNINNISEIRGKKVSAKLGTVAHLILLEALQSVAIAPQEVEIIDVSNERGAELLAQGKVDAAVMWEPLLGKTIKNRDFKIIFDTADVDSLVVDCLAIRSKSVTTNKNKLIKFILAWFDAIQDVKNKPELVFAAIAKRTNQTPEAVAKGYSGLKKGDIALNKRMFDKNGRLEAIIGEAQRLLREDPRHGRVIRDDVEIASEPLMQAISIWKSQ